MILTITPNPAWDVTISAPRIAWGESTRIDTAVVRAGGKGVNVARVLAAAGYDVTALVPVSPADAARFAEDLAGVDAELISVARPVRHSFAVVEGETSAATVMNERGGALDDAEWERLVARATALLARARCVVVSGSVPPETDLGRLGELLRRAAAERVPVIADLSGDALLTAARAGAGMLKPNRDELREATGELDPLAGARALQRAGAGAVVVSLGGDGMVLVQPDGAAVRARLAEPLPGNPTGAGDAAVAAFASCHVDGVEDAASVLRRAVAWSAAAVLEPAAGSIHPSWPELMARVHLEDLDPES